MGEETWPAEHIETLKALWGTGVTAAGISERIGRSRSAVIAKAGRLNLATLRTGPIAKWTDEQDATLRDLWDKRLQAGTIGKHLDRSRSSIMARVRFLKLPIRPGTMRRVVVEHRRLSKPLHKPVEIPAEEPKSLAVPFSKRTPLQCSWIAGEPKPNATVCGHRIQAGSSYCIFHHAVVWQRVEKRVR